MRPGLDAFKFTEEEIEVIKGAMNTARPWECNEVGGIKKRIKEFHSAFGDHICCYCYRDQIGEFTMVIDIEHIVPKRHFKEFTFDMRNLSVACKRCNMKMKRDKMDFLNDPFSAGDIEQSGKYKLVHPNIDVRDGHLERIAYQRNAKRLVKYVVLPDSEKGAFAYDYFQLHEFEVDSFDKAQGANIPDGQEGRDVSEVRSLVRELEQSASNG